jgi:methylated-DNA-[protein]-cysteine S-methyltransferase
MKLLPVSPVTFRASCSRPPETVYVTGVSGSLGGVVLAGTGDALLCLGLDQPVHRFAERLYDLWGAHPIYDSGPFDAINDDIRAYLDGEKTLIRAVVQPVMVPSFVIAVHETIARIPFGATITYGELAILSGHPGAARAAGNACARNRVLIAVPCHRVVAAGGIGGFGGNIPLKRRLLLHEGISGY